MCASEAPLHIEDTKCPHGWLQHGEITFQDYQMKYRDNTPIVLYSFNLTIHGQEVVGIVGRMGSGELSAWDTRVFIVGLWVSDLFLDLCLLSDPRDIYWALTLYWENKTQSFCCHGIPVEGTDVNGHQIRK